MGSFGKSLTESERFDRFQSGKVLQVPEHVSYSIRSCKISLLIYSGRGSLSNAGPFLYSPGRFSKLVIFSHSELRNFLPLYHWFFLALFRWTRQHSTIMGLERRQTAAAT